MRPRSPCDILPLGDRVVSTFRISSRQLGAVEVRAENWLIALGEGLAQLGVVDGLDRIACEVLMNGTTLVRDVRRGGTYIVQPLAEPVAPALVGPPPDPEDTEDAAPLFAGTPSEACARWAARMWSARDRRSAVRLALEAAMSVIPCESGAVLLEQVDGTLLFAVAAGPEAHKLKNVSLPPRTGVAGFCVDHAVALTVTEAYRDQRFYREVDARTGYRTQSLLCAPVAVERRVYGCLELINSAGAVAFTHTALEEAVFLADALAQRLAR